MKKENIVMKKKIALMKKSDYSMKKKVIFSALVIVVIIFIIFLFKFDYKKIKIGNNESNKSVEQVKEYILNMNSYTAEIDLTVNSNKNVNKYILKQEYKNNNVEKQMVVAPENIAGTTISYNNGNIEISNSNLNLSKIYNNYPYLSENVLWLSSFATECKNNLDKLNVYVENEYIVMQLNNSSNKYLSIKKLYLEKGTGKPKKMVVQDDNKKDIIYILYKEIEINN